LNFTNNFGIDINTNELIAAAMAPKAASKKGKHMNQMLGSDILELGFSSYGWIKREAVV